MMLPDHNSNWPVSIGKPLKHAVRNPLKFIDRNLITCQITASKRPLVSRIYLHITTSSANISRLGFSWLLSPVSRFTRLKITWLNYFWVFWIGLADGSLSTLSSLAFKMMKVLRKLHANWASNRKIALEKNSENDAINYHACSFVRSLLLNLSVPRRHSPSKICLFSFHRR